MQVIKSVAVWIDHRLTFKVQANSVLVKRRDKLAWLTGIVSRKGSSPTTIQYVATTTILPALLSGAEAWWNATRMIVDPIAPTYHRIAHLITGLPKFA